MTILQSEIAVGSEQYQKNKEALLTQLSEVRAIQQKSIDKSYAAKPKFDKRARFCRMSVYDCYSMLIHLLLSCVAWSATTCMMIKMVQKLEAG